jgi:hypothetical protein
MWTLDVGDPAPRFLAPPPAGANAKHLTLHERALRWRGVIDSIHLSAGWGWATPYKGNGFGTEWCGLFAAACWRKAGIDPKWLAPFFASTLRLYSWAHYRDWNDHKNQPPPVGASRRLAMKLSRDSKVADLLFEPRAGDIAVVGSDPNHPEGRHITVVTGFDRERSFVTTVEGNGGGYGPDEKWREGIVVGTRKIGADTGDVVLWIYRPAESDLLPLG